MTLCRVFAKEDGKVAVYHPNPALQQAGEDEAAFLERMGAEATVKDPSLAGLAYADLDTSELPRDRAERDAWRLEGGKVVVARDQGRGTRGEGKGRRDG
jgi:hypothetical protein